MLEVGCGTGAILEGIALQGYASLYGLDLSHSMLTECRHNVPAAILTRGDAGSLPLPARTFDIVFCHYLLLWVSDPLKALQEMKRLTKHGGCILALAEPDYLGRMPGQGEFSWLCRLQTESLRTQGAQVAIGSLLAELFYQAGIHILETGAIHSRGSEILTAEEWEAEWVVLESDLAVVASPQEIKRSILLKQQTQTHARSLLDVPTYFAWGQV